LKAHNSVITKHQNKYENQLKLTQLCWKNGAKVTIGKTKGKGGPPYLLTLFMILLCNQVIAKSFGAGKAQKLERFGMLEGNWMRSVNDKNEHNIHLIKPNLRSNKAQ